MTGKGHKHLDQAGRAISTLILPPKYLPSPSVAGQSLGQQCRPTVLPESWRQPSNPLPSDSDPFIQVSSPKHPYCYSIPCPKASSGFPLAVGKKPNSLARHSTSHNLTNPAFLTPFGQSHLCLQLAKPSHIYFIVCHPLVLGCTHIHTHTPPVLSLRNL